MKEPVVVAQKHNASAEEATLVEQIAQRAQAHGHRVLLVPDLYHLPEDSEIWQTLRLLPSVVTLWAWQHPRPLRWLLARHGIAAEEWRIIDLRTIELPQTEKLGPPETETQNKKAEPLPAAPSSTQKATAFSAPTSDPPAEATTATALFERHEAQITSRWYPIIDHERCSLCGQCVDFCLFGVYERTPAGVRVVAPDNCKPGCPACARLCPQGAIMFPLYEDDPAIAGAFEATSPPVAPPPEKEQEMPGKAGTAERQAIEAEIEDLIARLEELHREEGP